MNEEQLLSQNNQIEQKQSIYFCVDEIKGITLQDNDIIMIALNKSNLTNDYGQLLSHKLLTRTQTWNLHLLLSINTELSTNMFDRLLPMWFSNIIYSIDDEFARYKGGIVSIYGTRNDHIGMDINIPQYRYGLWVLTEAGENLVKAENGNNINSWGISNYITNIFFKGDNSLGVILKNPVKFITKNNIYDKSTILNLFVPNTSPHQINKMKEEIDILTNYINQVKAFDFHKIIYDSKLLDEEKRMIGLCYVFFSMCLRKYGGNCVVEACYIGQTASPLNTWARDNPTNSNVTSVFSPKEEYNTDDKVQDIKDRYSQCNNSIRKWYEKNKDNMGKLMTSFNCKNSVIKELKSKNGQVADIYPAQKVIMMLFFLTFLFTKMNISIGTYRNMIASYIIYVNLFNSVCACKMEKVWNKNISNSYVYEYIKINGQQLYGNMDIDPGLNIDAATSELIEKVQYGSREDADRSVERIFKDPIMHDSIEKHYIDNKNINKQEMRQQNNAALSNDPNMQQLKNNLSQLKKQFNDMGFNMLEFLTFESQHPEISEQNSLQEFIKTKKENENNE